MPPLRDDVNYRLPQLDKKAKYSKNDGGVVAERARNVRIPMNSTIDARGNCSMR